MSEPTRIEKMVGTILGLRMIVAQLLAAQAADSADPTAFVDELRSAALKMLDSWPIGSDSPESAENIRRSAIGMLTEFPGPTNIS